MPRDISVSHIDRIGHALVEARISQNLTQKALATRAGLKEQQIQRYEKEFYSSANLRRLSLIAAAMGFVLDGASLRKSGQGFSSDVGFSTRDLPFLEMRRAGWFGPDLKAAHRVDDAQREAVLAKFLREASGTSLAALHRKTTASVSPPRRAALFAWQFRVLERAKEVVELYPRFSPLDSNTISNFAQLSASEDGVEKALHILSRHGIIVVFEPHLEKTRIDGAALSLNRNTPVIGMSLRFDRVDNFWFVLLHELGHIMRHWDHVVSKGIIDEDAGGEAMELIEREADEFAENAILPVAMWKNSMVRFSKDPDQVIKFAARHNLHPALIAGRIRRERGYKEFHDLLGKGEIPKQLMQLGLLSETIWTSRK